MDGGDICSIHASGVAGVICPRRWSHQDIRDATLLACGPHLRQNAPSSPLIGTDWSSPGDRTRFYTVSAISCHWPILQ